MRPTSGGRETGGRWERGGTCSEMEGEGARDEKEEHVDGNADITRKSVEFSEHNQEGGGPVRRQ